MSNYNADSIMALYRERERFILFGLTGRTGSGCSTVSEILSTENIKNLSLHSYKTCDYSKADERKYSIIYRFMKEGKKWTPFKVIEASSIIFTFILQDNYQNLWRFIDQLYEHGSSVSKDELREKIVKCLTGDEDVDVNSITKQVVDEEIKEALTKLTKIENNSDEEEINQLIELFTVRINNKKNKFAKLLKDYRFKKKPEEPKDSNDTKEKGDEQIYNLYTYFMQSAGNNIRKSGTFYDDERTSGKEFSVVKRIDQIIQMILKGDQEKESQPKTRICIDALRNPMEIEYFRDKYRAFYALAVNTEDDYRQRRLGLSIKEIESIDRIEYPDEKDYYFYHQNIQACLQIADIYVYNPNVPNKKYYELTEQLLKYIALILQPGLVTPTHLERCMQLAFNAKYNSGCLSRKVGAVVTGDDFSIRSVGWNDVPKGQVACNLRCIEDYCRNQDRDTFSQYELTDKKFMEAIYYINNKIDTKPKSEKTGKMYAYCFKDIYNGINGKNNQVYTRALHAEENAFLQISKYGGAGIEGGKLFSTASPCELCSKKAYQLGIKEIYYIDPYPGISKSHILSFGVTGNPEMILFKGAIGNAYISLYSPKLPYKDEIKSITGVSAKDCSEEIYKRYQKEN